MVVTNLYTIPIDDRSMQRSAAAVATRTTMCATEEENKKQLGRTLGAALSKGGPSAEALAMAGGRRCMPAGACRSEPDHVDDDDSDAMPPEHLRAFEAFLEEVVPVGMIMASRREEEVRLRRGGKPRSYDDDVKEKLKLWAKAVARETTGGRR